MSLVAYGSSGESSESETEEDAVVVNKVDGSCSAQTPVPITANNEQSGATTQSSNHAGADQISDSDSDIPTDEIEAASGDTGTDQHIDSLLKALPVPKDRGSGIINEDDELEDEVKPKASQMIDLPKPPPKKTKQPVQITIPALPDSDEEDGPAKKKIKRASTAGKSGLIALLPAPMFAAKKETNRILVPHSLSKKPKHVEKKSSVVKPASEKPPSQPVKLQGLTGYDSNSDDDDSSESSNYFSLDSSSKPEEVCASPSVTEPGWKHRNVTETSNIPTVPLPPEMSENLVSEGSHASDSVSNSSSHNKLSLPAPKNITDSYVNNDGPTLFDVGPSENKVDPDAPLTFKGGAQVKARPIYSVQRSYEFTSQEQAANEMDVDAEGYYKEYPSATPSASYQEDEMFLRMQGKKQRGKEEINIVDVNADDFISTVEVTKNLSEEQEYVSQRKKENMPTSQQRRKHQISYLAFQAKEQELQLKNQWATNRQTKKQTQAKYGF